MIRFLISRPIAVVMIFIAAVTLGIISYNTIPISLMPDIPIPEVTINVIYKNSSARELENAIVKPLRMQLMQVEHLDDIRSESRDGSAIIHLRYKYGSNIDYAFIEANEKIDDAMNSLPRDMERPRVIKASATDIPVFYLNLTLKDTGYLNPDSSEEVSSRFMELCEFSENVIRKRIEQLPEVSMVDISGIVSPQLVIEPDMDKMFSLNLTISQLEQVLSRNNINIGSLMVNDGHYQYNIRFNSLLRTQEDIENIYFIEAGRIFKMKEIARINILPQKRSGMFASNGKPAVSMAVIKQADARLSKMKSKIKKMIEQFEIDYPNIHFEASQDQTQILDYSISNLKQNLGQGLILITLVVFFFLKDIKSPILIGLTLIVSVIVCMLFFRVFNLSINIISLAGLILAIGNMMDNSIIVTDNITQYRERGLNIDDACVSGTNEVIIPMLSSMLTNISIFLPMIFLSGMAGALIYDEAVSVSIGLVVSYIVGITLMPVIYRLAYNNTHKAFSKIQHWKKYLFKFSSNYYKKVFDLDKVYERGLEFTFSHKRLNLLIYTLILPIGIIVLFMMRKEKMPELPQTEVIININWNENINIGENKKRVYEVLRTILSVTEQSNCYIGQQQFVLNREKELSTSEAKIYIKAKNRMDIKEIEKTILNFINTYYPRSMLSFDPPISMFEKLFNNGEPPLVAEISPIKHGREYDIASLLELNRELNKIQRLNSYNNIALQDNIVIEIDYEKLLLYDVTFNVLYQELNVAFKDFNIGTLRSFQQYIPIVITGTKRNIFEIISTLKVYNNENVLVPVKALVNVLQDQDLKTINASKKGEYIPFTYYPTSSEKDQYIYIIDNTVKKSKIYKTSFSGSLLTNQKILKELGIVLIISVLLLYFILAAQFESLVLPLLVLLELPIDYAGAIIILFLMGQSLNLMSIIGIIIMSGIVINDSILKIDLINKLRREGYPLLIAIKTGGLRRLRAIIMTSLTSILAMLPLLFSNDLGSELQKPFSYSLIGGMVIGTIVSLYFVPLVYWYIFNNKKLKINV